MIKHLVIGVVEVGTGLAEILQCAGIDRSDGVPKADIMHICFPYSEQFAGATGASFIVIHSTVPIGTTSNCDEDAAHSSVRGKHPHLTEGIKAFVKFLGGKRAEEVTSHFSTLGIETITTKKPENIEAMKLWGTEIYREAILLNKHIRQYHEKHEIDFDIAYTLANKTCNDGYTKLEHSEFTKYVLRYVRGPIGGHCLEPNRLMLNQ